MPSRPPLITGRDNEPPASLLERALICNGRICASAPGIVAKASNQLTLSNNARCRSSAEPVGAAFASFEIIKTGPNTSSSTDSLLPFPRPVDSCGAASEAPPALPATACSFWCTEVAERNAGGGSKPPVAALLKELGLLLPVTKARRPDGEVEPIETGAVKPKAGIRLPTAG